MTIVRVLLPKIPWKHKEGAILKGASNVPQNCRMETTAFGKKHPGRSWRCATRTTESLKRSVVSSWKKKKGCKRVRLKEDTSGLKREDIMFQIRHFYLQPKWWIPAKVKITEKERKTVNPVKIHIHVYKTHSGLFLPPLLWQLSGNGLVWQESSCFVNFHNHFLKHSSTGKAMAYKMHSTN